MFKKKTPYKDPPLVDVKVTNPTTYIKNWWAKIIGNEGVEFTFKIKPLTAFVIASIIAAAGFGFGVNIEGTTEKRQFPTSTPDPWKETAFIGTLKFSDVTRKYFLITSTSAEAITLNIPEGINLQTLIEKRILAAGNYNKSTRILVVSDAKDMEVLPKSPIPIPTSTSTPTPFPIITATPTPEEFPSPTPAY